MENAARAYYRPKYRVIALQPGVMRRHAVILVQPCVEQGAFDEVARFLGAAAESRREAEFSVFEVLGNHVSRLHKLRDEIDVVLNPAQPVVFCVEVPSVMSEMVSPDWQLGVPGKVTIFLTADGAMEAAEQVRNTLSLSNPSLFMSLDWHNATVAEYVRQTNG